MKAQDGKPLGIISLGGSLPLSLAKTLTASNIPFRCVGFENITSPQLGPFSPILVPFFKIGQLIAVLRQSGCERVVFAGQFFRPRFFNMRFDATLLRNLPLLLFARSGGDDTIMKRVTHAFEKEGFDVVGLKDIAPTLVAQEGQLGRHEISTLGREDMLKGSAILNDVGRHDIGQCMVIDRGRTIAIEAAEGTDAMLKRVRDLRGTPHYPANPRSGVLIKAAKPQQELRNDMPVVGLQTVLHAAEAGLSAIAVQAGHVLLADLPEMINTANQSNIAIYGFPAETGRG